MNERPPTSECFKNKTGFFLFLATLMFQAWNIGHDLPNLYHADEPHHLNIAAHFSTGDLNPHDFKYPTLWSYTLAVMLGLLFALNLLTGLVSSGLDFASSYFYEPTKIYLCARLLAAALFAGGVWVLYETGRKHYNHLTGLLAAAFLATGPAFWFYSRYATMNSLMIFLITLGVYFLHGVLNDADRKSYILAGLAFGLAISAHYIAAPLGFLIVAFHFLTPKSKRQHVHLLYGCLFVFVGFFIGTPFFLFDLKKALGDVFALGQLHVVALGESSQTELASRQVNRAWQFLQIIKNSVYFLDPFGLGLGCFLLALGLSKNKRTLAQRAVWALPMVIMAVILSGAYHGNFYRYALGVYVPLVLPAAMGFSTLVDRMGKQKKYGLMAAGAIVMLFVMRSSVQTIELGRPDTRTLAKAWLNAHVPQGDKILLTDPFNTPQLTKSLTQVQELLVRGEKINHPRRHYYRALAHNHPGGGYMVYYLRRSLTEVEDTPERTERAYQSMESLDLATQGLKMVRQNNIKTVVVAKDFLYEKRNLGWMKELRERCILENTFYREPGLTQGPNLDIYSCP